MGNWNIVANVAGVQPFEPGFKRIPEGAYAVQIKDSDLKTKEGGTSSLHFEVLVTEAGESQGTPVRIIVGTDFTKDFNKKHMRALLIAIGANPAALDSGNLNLDASMFAGKSAFMYVEARDGVDENGKKLYDNRNFCAPAYYQKWKAENAGKVAAPAAGNGAAAPAGLAGLGAAVGGAPAPGAFAGGALFGKQ